MNQHGRLRSAEPDRAAQTCSHDAPARIGSPATTGPAHLTKRRLVYVVDDDPSMLRGVKRLLREHGYDSVLFASADAFRKHNDFDDGVCAIIDIDLSDESGIEVRHRMTAAGISLPVIFITGRDNHATRMAAISSGCLAYLTKPFTASSLMAPVELASAERA
jgi:FixJ family two-component response regulator